MALRLGCRRSVFAVALLAASLGGLAASVRTTTAPLRSTGWRLHFEEGPT